MNFSSPQKTVILWQIRATVTAALFVFVFFRLCIKISTYFIIGVAVCAGVWAAAVFWYLPALIHSFKADISAAGIVIKRGVIVKTERIMPETRLVFVKVAATPLSLIFGLKTVSFLAAKARVSTFELKSGDAERIISFIKQVNENGE